MDIMLDLQETAPARVGAGDGVVPDILTDLDLGWVVVQITLRVQIEVYDMIAHSG